MVAEQKSSVTMKMLEDEVKHVPLTDIYVDYNWNSRSLANVASEEKGEKEGGKGGLTLLMAGIYLDGQDTPVDVTQVPEELKKKANGKPYMLRAGFRRFMAVQKINEDKDLVKRADEAKRSVVPNTANGTIRAVVRTLTEAEARLLNVRENTDREDLTPPDLCSAVNELYKKHKMAGIEIARHIGISYNYVALHIRVGEGVRDDILQHWKHGGEYQGQRMVASVTIRDLDDLSKLDKDRQPEEYLRILKGKSQGIDGTEKAKMWLESAKKKASAIGAMLGTLQRDKFLKVDSKVPWIEAMFPEDRQPTMVRVGNKELKRSEIRKIADVAEKAFAAALTRKDEPEEDEVE